MFTWFKYNTNTIAVNHCIKSLWIYAPPLQYPCSSARLQLFVQHSSEIPFLFRNVFGINVTASFFGKKKFKSPSSESSKPISSAGTVNKSAISLLSFILPPTSLDFFCGDLYFPLQTICSTVLQSQRWTLISCISRSSIEKEQKVAVKAQYKMKNTK